MQLREYLKVRALFNGVRSAMESSKRITFEEYSLLCHLLEEDCALSATDLATYQGVLRPTVAYRIAHLADLGYVKSTSDVVDRRCLACKLTKRGEKIIETYAHQMCEALLPGETLSQSRPERMPKYVDAMGSPPLATDGLVLLVLFESSKRRLEIFRIVSALSLLQPTISLAIKKLVEQGSVTKTSGRRTADSSDGREIFVSLTPKGRLEAKKIAAHIQEKKIKRTRKPTSSDA